MTSERVVEWTCDMCLKVERAVGLVGAPAGWTGLAVNMEAADGSWDHNGWHRFHLCPECGPDDDGELFDAFTRRGIEWPRPRRSDSEVAASEGVPCRGS